MPQWLVFLILGSIFLILVIIKAILHDKKPVKGAIISMFSGIGTLILTNLLGPIIGISIPISFLSLCAAAIAGIPGIATLILLSVIL